MTRMIPSDPQPPHHQNGVDRPSDTVWTATETGNELELRSILRSLRRNIWLIVACTIVAGGIAAKYASEIPARYAAVSTLRTLDERRMLTGGMEVGFAEIGGRQADPIMSQLQILQSRSILGQVVDRVGLRLAVIEGSLPRSVLTVTEIAPTAEADTLLFRFGQRSFTVTGLPQSISAAYGEQVNAGGLAFSVQRAPAISSASAVLLDRNEVIDGLSRALTPRVRERTDLIDLEYISEDPVLAQLVVNVTAEVFRQHSQDAARELSRRRRDFVEARLDETENVLADAQQRLIDFQRREQVFSSQDKFATQQSTLYSLDLRRADLQAERDALAALLAQVPANALLSDDGIRAIVSAPGTSQSPIIPQLYGQLVQYQVAQDEMIARGSSTTHPDYVRMTRLIESTRRNIAAAVESQIASTEARISALDDLRRQYRTDLAGMPAVQAEEARLLLDFETVRRSAEQLREEAQRARIAEAVEVGQVQVVDLAPLPTRPLSQGRMRIVLMGLAIGLLIGAGTGIVREQLNTSIRAEADVELQLGIPSLVVVPRIDGGNGRRLPPPSSNGNENAVARRADGDGSLIAVSAPHSPSAEAFRTLRTNLMFSQTQRALEKLVVTSSETGEGKSTVSANLAVSYAQQGLRVLLIDCDLRRPRLHQIFKLPKSPGVTDFVMEHASLEEALQDTGVPGLHLLTCGTQPPNPAELIGGPRFRNSIAQLSQMFDIVIYDTPPMLAAAEAVILAARADGTVLVVRAGRTDRESVKHAIGQLRSVGAHLLGVVLNDVDTTVPKYSRYGHYYYSYYGAEELQDS